MTGNMSPSRWPDEQLVAALIPRPLPLASPPTAPVPTLPAPPPPRDGAEEMLFDVARPDTGGRVTAGALLRALRWPPGQCLTVDVADGAVLITSAPDGAHVVGTRKEIPLPAAARHLTPDRHHRPSAGPPCGPPRTRPAPRAPLEHHHWAPRRPAHPHPRRPPSADPARVASARQVLTHLALTPGDLTTGADHCPAMPTVAEYFPRVAAAASPGTRRTYGIHWNRMAATFGDRRLDALRRAYTRLGEVRNRPAIFGATYFGELGDALPALLDTPVEAIGLDLVAGPSNLERLAAAGPLRGKTIVAGLVDGHNIWRTDLRAAVVTGATVAGLADHVAVSTSCSLLPPRPARCCTCRSTCPSRPASTRTCTPGSRSPGRRSTRSSCSAGSCATAPHTCPHRYRPSQRRGATTTFGPGSPRCARVTGNGATTPPAPRGSSSS